MIPSLKVCADKKQWDALVESAPHATIFHKWSFLRKMEKYTGGRLYPMIFFKDEKPAGLYPLFYHKNKGIKMVFSPPPHCAVPYLGPLLLGYDALTQTTKESVYVDLQSGIDNFLNEELSADYISVITPPGLIDSRPLFWAGYCVTPSYDYIMDLTLPEEVLWDRLGKKLRAQISKEKSSGYAIESGGREELLIIYDMLVNRYKEQGRTVSVPKEYLLEIFDEFYPENMKVWVAKYQGECIGGLADLYYKGKAASWVGNPKPKVGTNVNELLQYEAVLSAKKSGCTVYEEMGANTKHLCRYKSKFNPNLAMHYNAKKCKPAVGALENAYMSFIKPFKNRMTRLVK